LRSEITSGRCSAAGEPLDQILGRIEEMRELKVAMLGFGNAGRAFAELLLNKKEEIKRAYSCDVKVVAIATGSRGSLVT